MKITVEEVDKMSKVKRCCVRAYIGYEPITANINLKILSKSKHGKILLKSTKLKQI